MKENELFNVIQFHNELRYKDIKISYFILKPNSARNYEIIINEIEKNFCILNQFAILNYDFVNNKLHENQLNSQKYLVPISKYYNDYYGNYAMLVLVGKRNIDYSDFCVEVCKLKKQIRNLFKRDYVSLVFDTSNIGVENFRQTIEILSCNGKIVKKDAMNRCGTFMIFSVNEIHSPDITVEDTINELKLLHSLGIFSKKNKLDTETITKLRKYKTYEFLKDLN